jgi:YD repeat-containing protein
MKNVETAVVFAALPLLASIGHTADAFPRQLVGIWATAKSEFRGEALTKGQALYLYVDGVGAIVGGPPPIGVRIEATYDANSNKLSITMTDGGKTRSGTFIYDAARKIIVDNGVEYHQRADHVSAAVRKQLELEARSQ